MGCKHFLGTRHTTTGSTEQMFKAEGSCRVSEQPLFGEALETGLGPSIQILNPSEYVHNKVRRRSGRCKD